MCGIVAVLRRPSDHPPADPGAVLAGLDAALGRAAGETGPAAVRAAAEEVAAVDALLRTGPGVQALVAGGEALASDVSARVSSLEHRLGEIESALDAMAAGDEAVEDLNAALVELKDAVWAIGRDRLPTAAAVASLAGTDASSAAIEGYLAIQLALSALDRLEVRGRDSAGLHVLVTGHGLDVGAAEVAAALEARAEPLFTSGAVRVTGATLGFVYKAAAEVGELGDNTATLRRAIAGDGLLRQALSSPGSHATVLAHTRWASVGIISEANAHPVNSEEEDGSVGPYVVAALNGDVDNYAELRAEAGLRIPDDITTDAKVIPALISRRMADGVALGDAFRHTVATFDGSVAVAAASGEHPDKLLLALRGSGQGLYVGLADDMYVVASEPYGLVEVTPHYLRMDGEAANGGGSPGQMVVLDRAAAGTIDGIERRAYDGQPLPVAAGDISTAEITTRDIDRRGYPHFLLKEMAEAPDSMRKTLRGKIAEDAPLLRVVLPDSSLPAKVRDRLASGQIRRILAIGQGTAAVAGQAVAAALEAALGTTDIAVAALPATELSGFGLADDMSDTLVVAISQSGTTTDTNRTVDLVRSRGAVVVGIVNRRNSDLVEKADGILYTSDGRDVEMAVPSTKAFYAQIAAGVLLARAVAAAAGCDDRHATHELLASLRRLPDALEQVLAQRSSIARAAQLYGPARRYWAMVGNGPNRVAAQELRIKLSELCYKSIACDVTEDKKHIDLSAEPLILVCAAGLPDSTADDVAKEVAIYRAHKAAPIVITSDDGGRYTAALEVVQVPAVHPTLDFVGAAMAGHLFGYEAAVAIDAQSRQLRQLRSAVEELVTAGVPDDRLVIDLRAALDAGARRFFSELQAGAFNGHLEASTAVRLASLLRYAVGAVPLEAYEIEYGKVGSPQALVDDLISALTAGVEELSRPIDAIKHQAKTVTVGISRAEETFAGVPLVLEALAAGATRDRIGYRGLRALAALDPAVAAVRGYTRYQIDGDVDAGTATIHVVDQGGVARSIPSRTAHDPQLKGIKRRVASSRRVWAARGERDRRTLVLVPETKDADVVGITLLHADFHDRLEPATARAVLTGYHDNRYNALVDAVTETEASFDDRLLAEVPIIDLLVEPVLDIAQRWRDRSGQG